MDNSLNSGNNYYNFYNESGDSVWSYELPGIGNSIHLSNDQHLLLAGDYSNDMLFFKYDLDGRFDDIFLLKPYGRYLLSFTKQFTFNWSIGFDDLLTIEYSTNQGSSWNIFGENIPSENLEFEVEIPFLNSDEGLVRISSQNNPMINDLNNYPLTFSVNSANDFIDINESKMWVGNLGQSSHNPYTDHVGYYWPLSSGDTTLTAIFEDGLVWGCYVNSELRVNGDTYRYGLQPGKILSEGVPDNKYRGSYNIWVYDRNWDLLPPGSERDRLEYNYNNWPINLGAPFTDKDGDGKYTYGIDLSGVGDETLFNVMNDLDSNITTFTYGTMPIGLEVQ